MELSLGPCSASKATYRCIGTPIHRFPSTSLAPPAGPSAQEPRVVCRASHKSKDQGKGVLAKPAVKGNLTQQVSPRVTAEMNGLYDKLMADILAMNKARLQAVEQASTVMKKNKELERRVMELEVESARLRQVIETQSLLSANPLKANGHSTLNSQNGVHGTLGSLPSADKLQGTRPEASTASSGNTATSAHQAKPNPPNQPSSTQQAPVAAPPPAATAPPNQTTQLVAIIYHTGWHNCHIHFNGEKGGWTQSPGVKMVRANDGTRVRAVPGSRLEFVLNDGGKDWDNGAFGDDGVKHNYIVKQPGVYVLKNGRIEQVRNANLDDYKQYLV